MFRQGAFCKSDHDLAFDGLASIALATCNWPRTATLSREVPARVAKGASSVPSPS